LFVPQNADESFWHATDGCQKNLLHWGMRNDKVDCVKLLEWFRSHISPEKWAEFILTQETMQGYSALLTVSFFQATITDEIMQHVIPPDYSTNVEFWRKKMFFTHQFHAGATLIHFPVKNPRPHAFARLQMIKKYMIAAVWQELLWTQDLEGRTPLMMALQLNPEISEEMVDILIPENCKTGENTSFWELLSRDSSTCIHLGIMNANGTDLKRLQYLKQRIPETIWNTLLTKKNTSIFQETPEETALRFERSKHVIQLLQPSKSQ